jgi:hypothetical protein
LWSKRKLWWGFLTKVIDLRLVVGIKTWQSLIGMVG